MDRKMNAGNEKPSALARTPWHQVVRLRERGPAQRSDPSGTLLRGGIALDGLGADDHHCRPERASAGVAANISRAGQTDMKTRGYAILQMPR